MDIQKCHAYNATGLRCMQPAGHDLPHAHAIEWDDDECWTPETFARTAPIASESHIEHLVAVPKGSGKCVICGHAMHLRACTDLDGEFDCDCATGIEE